MLNKLLEKFSKSMLKRNKGVGIDRNVDTKHRLATLKDFNKSKSKYKKELFDNMALLRQGKLSKDDFLKIQKKTIEKHFTTAFEKGKTFGQLTDVGLTDDERRFIVYQTTKEMSYMSKFADDMLNGKGRMNYQRRMKMYADGLDPMFQFGNLAYLPENIRVVWNLGVTDKHCLDCLFFAHNSPYNKKDVPGVPKSGNSKCLSNCRCYLSFIADTVDTHYSSFLINNHKATGSALPSELEYLHLQQLERDYYKFRLKYEVVKDKNLMETAKSKREEIKNYISNNDFAIKMPMLVQTPVVEVGIFNNSNNFQYVDSIVNVRKGDFISFFHGKQQAYGKIRDVNGLAISITGIGNKTELYSFPDLLIFKEI